MKHLDQHLHLARTIARALDSQFSLFGIKFGFDSLLGLIPGVGDFVGLIFSSYLFWIGVKMQLPKPKLAQMLFNLGFDAVLGTVPLLGDIADIFFKANLKNLQILEEYAGQKL